MTLQKDVLVSFQEQHPGIGRFREPPHSRRVHKVHTARQLGSFILLRLKGEWMGGGVENRTAAGFLNENKGA